jgi:hypothetical protein
MSELDVTAIVQAIEPADYSASCAELGENAGRITWANATRDALELFGDAFNREEFDSYFRGFGAWDDAELAAHTNAECAALMLQFISGDLRECDFADWPEQFSPEWWQEYESASSSGIVSGRFSRADDGRVFYDYGS